MTNHELQAAIEVMKANGFEVVMPGLMTKAEPAGRISDLPTIERPATQDAEMERALASSRPGGDLAMASHAGLALSIGDLQHRVVQLEDGLNRLAGVLLGKDDAVERPDHVEHEPDPTPAVEDEAPSLMSDDVVDTEPPTPSTVDPQALCTCGHSRLSHNGSKYACEHGRHAINRCECMRFVEYEGLIS